ncbi:MAG: hypothetical protein QG662_998 [Pseudomonadota bacterium]|nr:hypothetical protein [Pseudomonadota bacterium]
MLLVIPHLFPTARLLETAAHDLRLPALKTVLTRGARQACTTDGVEAYLCERLGIERQQDWPIAPITLEADGGHAESAYWLRADPVHLSVMRDRIVLADSATLDLGQSEADALTTSIHAHFGAAFSPRPVRPQRWYLRLPEPPQLATTPLSCAAGRDIDPLLPRGRDAQRFRALMNELQMLLHDHPVNQAREARGALPVNSLWLWGGGLLPKPGSSSLRVASSNPEIVALARFAGAGLAPAPDRSSDEHAGIAVIDTLVASSRVGDAFGWREAIRQIENHLHALLRTGQAFTLADPMRGIACRWGGRNRFQFWRRRAPLKDVLK